jgi:Integral membrane protein, interacts with FtsH
MFTTLMSKTFLLLAVSLVSAYLGSIWAIKKIKDSVLEGNPSPRGFWVALIADIVSFILLLFLNNVFPINIILLLIFTLSSGYTLGMYTLAYGDVAEKAIALTAATTLLTGVLATFSGIDFTFIGKLLMISLVVFVILSIIFIFVKIKEGTSRFMAAFGTLIFTGYLLFDFSRLAKLKTVAEANNWGNALSMAINIYLDIINLLMQLMQLMSGGSHHS